MLRIFLAHAKEDEAAVMGLYNKLKAQGYHPWLDKKDLLLGQNWRTEISKAIRGSQVFIACLSQRSVSKSGYVQREFRMALNEYANKPPGSIYLIPLRLDDCDIPDLRQEKYGVNLRDLHWGNLFEEDGFEQLMKTLRQGFPDAKPLPPEMASSLPLVSLVEPDVSSKVPSAPTSNTGLLTYSFDVVTVNASGRELTRQQQSAQHIREDLGGGVTLDAVLVPAGTFLMGSPDSELERSGDEGPQRSVTVPQFFMGKYPVTQAQWRVVAAMPEVKVTLEANPSRVEGDLHPVEQVSWYEAVEFCDRLTRHTDRQYRLPTEAEWEYACRGGTTTPFHFGETITPEFANYRGSVSYGDGPKGEYRETTTPVDHFGKANVYGLSELHGNVLEWCEDHWHKNYQGAPTDGSAWLTDAEKAPRILRGGSWLSDPRDCRSAYRNYYFPDDRYYDFGFRVSCSSPRTLL